MHKSRSFGRKWRHGGQKISKSKAMKRYELVAIDDFQSTESGIIQTHTDKAKKVKLCAIFHWKREKTNILDLVRGFLMCLNRQEEISPVFAQR